MMARVLFAVATLAAVGAQASTLIDPTRPTSRATAGAARAQEPVSYGPVLQSTRISVESKSAVISGRTVVVGDVVGGAVVADIRPYEVILRKDGRETALRMLPRLTVKEKR